MRYINVRYLLYFTLLRLANRYSRQICLLFGFADSESDYCLPTVHQSAFLSE